MQDQILKFVKQNPAIIAPKSTSPCPPAMAATLSPRCPSPGVPNLLQQPQPSSPRAPSPISKPLVTQPQPSSPRAPSPISKSLVTQPQPSSPRAPSPISKSLVTPGGESYSVIYRGADNFGPPMLNTGGSPTKVTVTTLFFARIVDFLLFLNQLQHNCDVLNSKLPQYQ